MTLIRKPTALVEGLERIAAALAGSDFAVHPEDFILYELHRLIDEDRASFDDPEFRNLIDEGIRAHIQENAAIRARMAGSLRTTSFTGEAQNLAAKVIHALEDMNADLCNVTVVVRIYIAYLCSCLEDLEMDPNDERIAAAADLLFSSSGDRIAAENALQVLCETSTPVTSRILAHAVAEPLLDEDLEARAYAALKASWPLPRHYMLYNLREHPHEDIPIRWFQLFAELDELLTVELVLEECRAHGDNPTYLEDLTTLVETLQLCKDPEIEDKILDAVNSPSTHATVLPLLRKFLEVYHPAASSSSNSWAQRLRALEENRAYLGAAALYDAGDNTKALEAVNELLSNNPGYPFAVMLKSVMEKAKD
jgi:hypothetical protein